MADLPPSRQDPSRVSRVHPHLAPIPGLEHLRYFEELSAEEQPTARETTVSNEVRALHDHVRAARQRVTDTGIHRCVNDRHHIRRLQCHAALIQTLRTDPAYLDGFIKENLLMFGLTGRLHRFMTGGEA